MEGSVFNKREVALPGLLAEAVNAFTAPGRSLLGTDPEFSAGKEGVNMAMNVMGGGLGTSKAMRNPTGQGGVDLALNAWHGTPHKIRGNFDINKVGTGEGAQAFGEGMYFAEARGTGEEYARLLANRNPENQGRLNAHANAQRLVSLAGDPKYAADDIKFVLESNPNHEQKKLLESTLRYVESGDYAKPLVNKGNLYKVDIPDEQIPRMMDWDKPISQQPNVIDSLRTLAKNKVEEKLLIDIENEIAASGKFSSPVANSDNYMAQLFSDTNKINRQEIQSQAKQRLASMDLTKLIEKEYNNLKPKDMTWDMTGKDFYENLSKTLGSPKKASEALSSYGVSGIRYLDAVSRNSDKKTSNFVVFKPETVKILEENDIPIANLLDGGLLGN
jgi:hypothetical protein